MRWSLVVITIAALFSWGSSAEGGHGWRLRIGAYNKQAAIAAYGRAVYPKYYGGFHARELQNVGVPHGDVGILGSGIQRDPW